MASSRSCDMARRRACMSPRLPRVISFSTTGLRSLALGRVVTICSCLLSAAAILGIVAWGSSPGRLHPPPRNPRGRDHLMHCGRRARVRLILVLLLPLAEEGGGEGRVALPSPGRFATRPLPQAGEG